ncbi:peptidase S8/S53 domain-containing protein [Nemania sp. FL0031]|nr:peptidase S8/S53 domain-containing protein [Nemania sp. FL0031]
MDGYLLLTFTMERTQEETVDAHAEIIEHLSETADDDNAVDAAHQAFLRLPVEERQPFLRKLVSASAAMNDSRPANQPFNGPWMLFKRLGAKPKEPFEGSEEIQKAVAKLAAENCLRLPKSITALGVIEEDELKEICIRGACSRDEKMRYLYPSMKDERSISLDLTSVTQQIDGAYLERLSAILQFEKFLGYVKLPQLKYEKQLMLGQKNDLAYVGYKFVFEWLKTKGVVKIFEISVVDLELPGHSDQSIIHILDGWDMKLWDWRRFDISSSTISQVAPHVEEVVLYFSGRKAVLESWASERGLIVLESLKKLTIKAFPEVEAYTASDIYLGQFETTFSKMVRAADREVIINTTFSGASPWALPHAQSGHLSVEQMSKTHFWLNHMEKFALEVYNLDLVDDDDKEIAKPSVKIALIDTGVNIGPGQEDIIVAKGRSFCAGGRDWFVEPFVHGTHMARCIQKICPAVELYVARLDDSTKYSEFTVRSATQAINWAVDLGVDIISMSWSFSEYNNASSEVNNFREAITRAHQKDIILFASMKDQAPLREDFRDYPIGLTETIGIGSATRYGEPAAYNTKGIAQFYLPGEGIQLPNPDPSNNGELTEVTGSSTATAFAAGLAGLILYCMKLVRIPLKDSEVDIAEKRIQHAHTTGGMTHIFQRMCRGNDFLEVWEVFPEELRPGEYEGLIDIQKVVEQLLPDVYVRRKKAHY